MELVNNLLKFTKHPGESYWEWVGDERVSDAKQISRFIFSIILGIILMVGLIVGLVNLYMTLPIIIYGLLFICFSIFVYWLFKT